MVEDLLPPSVLARAVRSGNEFAWRPSELLEVMSAAESAGLANLGGQPQYIFPDGICEPYWLSIDPRERSKDESWNAYVRRSAEEARTIVKRMLAETDFVSEARQFSFLAGKLESSEDVLSHLYFVLYFARCED